MPGATSDKSMPLPPRWGEDYAAWSSKCPKRPTKPIPGIPNIKVRRLNNNRIHRLLHDHIINIYINKLNSPNNAENRAELLQRLRKRFIENFNVETHVCFSEHHAYVLMFDVDDRERESPTDVNQETAGSFIRKDG